MRALCSDRPNCSHNVSQKVKRIRRFSEHGDCWVATKRFNKMGCDGCLASLLGSRTDQIALITCLKKLNVSGTFLTFAQRPNSKKQAEYGFGEYGFKHRTQ